MIGLLAIAAPVLAVFSDDSNNEPLDLEEKFLRACAFDNPPIFSVPFVAAVSTMTTDAFLELRSRLIADLIARPTRVERRVLSCALVEATAASSLAFNRPTYDLLDRISLSKKAGQAPLSIMTTRTLSMYKRPFSYLFLDPDGPEAWNEREQGMGPNASVLDDRRKSELVWLLLYAGWSGASASVQIQMTTGRGGIFDLEITPETGLRISCDSDNDEREVNDWARSIEARFWDSLSEADKMEFSK
jgi:hypothetical protein